MKHPELLKKMGKDNNRQALGLFQCPWNYEGCKGTFIARIDQVVNEHTKSCGCRRKKNFTEALGRRVRGKMTSQHLAAFLGERQAGANRAYLCKKYGITVKLYSTALRIAEEQYSLPPRTAFESSKPSVAEPVADESVGPQASVPPPSIYVQGDYVVQNITTNKPHSLIREVPFEQTEEYFDLIQRYVNDHPQRQMPPDDLDLRVWAQQKAAN